MYAGLYLYLYVLELLSSQISQLLISYFFDLNHINVTQQTLL